MFTGIIEEVGTVEEVRMGAHSAVLQVRAEKVLEETKTGDSIAVNGICLTATAIDSSFFRADVMHETLNRSALARLARGSRVNLERALRADGRFGGHIVTGHVDGTGRVVRIRRDDTAIWYTLQADPGLLRHIVEKGSVAVDGVSLTVARTDGAQFSVSAIPHTVSHTILGAYREGDTVNLETDVIGKYVEKLLCPAPGGGKRRAGSAPGEGKRTAGPAPGERISRSFLQQYGFWE